MPLILPGNVASATASTTYDVDNSCRFFSDTSLHKDNGGSATNRDKYTFSFWYKKCSNGVNQRILMISGSGTQGDGSDDYMTGYFKSDDTFRWQEYDGDIATPAYSSQLVTSQKFRDNSAWYHFVLRFDSTSGTADDRMRIYVNGTQVTSFGTRTNPDQNQDGWFADDDGGIAIGGISDAFCNGYLAEVVGVDGQSLAPTEFGEFDEDSPTIWKPKDVSGITLGNNGFYLDFEDSTNLGNDANGGTDFTEVNLAAADQSTDTCTNNFCTLNPVATSSGLGESLTFSEGNCKIANTSDAAWEPAIGTMAVKAGKWYCEMKTTAAGAESYGVMDPVQYNEAMPTADDINSCSRSYTMYYSDGNATSDDESTAWGEDYGTGDIISIAVDLDNMKLYMAKNGTWVASGDPTSGATGTGTHVYFGGSKDNTRAAGTDYYIFVCAIHNNSTSEVNFGGCPGFAISSGNADANGYGNFEYAVPSGYLALCTKNLGSDGG